MNFIRFVDDTHLLILLLAVIGILLLFIELGYRIGSGIGRVKVKAQISQVRAIMGASLGLLAFMLAFAFASGQSHFEARTQGLVYETNVVTTAYHSAELLEEPERSEIRGLLLKFVNSRIDIARMARQGNTERIGELLQESMNIHKQLWEIAAFLNAAGYEGNGVNMFTSSVLEMMNTQTARLEAVLYNRIPPIIWLTLLFMAILSMLTMGYQAGLTGARSHLATWTLAIAFSSVMMLIMDLDRPHMTLFKLNDQIMIDLKTRMEADTLQMPGEGHRRE
jgi:hypothetical protein